MKRDEKTEEPQNPKGEAHVQRGLAQGPQKPTPSAHPKRLPEPRKAARGPFVVLELGA